MLRPARALAALVTAAALALSLQAPAEAKPRPKDPDGTYQGNEDPPPDNGFDAVDISFEVKGNGRKIKDFVFTMNVVCVSYPYNDVQLVTQPMNPMKVNPRTGRFRDVVQGTTEGGTEYRVEVTGRLKNRKVRGGTLSYDVGVCQRGSDPGDPMIWAADRVGK